MKWRFIALVLVGICGVAITANSVPDKFFISHSTMLPPSAQISTSEKNIKSGGVDTLMPTIPPSGPFWISTSTWRKTYKATKFTPADPCSLMQIWVGTASLTAGQTSKQCSVMVWTDGATPGTRLLHQRFDV